MQVPLSAKMLGGQTGQCEVASTIVFFHSHTCVALQFGHHPPNWQAAEAAGRGAEQDATEDCGMGDAW